MHLFLTGNIQVGKTTIIQNYIKKYGYRIKGFRTVSGPFAEDGSSKVYMVNAENPASDMTEENVVIRRHGPNAKTWLTVHLEPYEGYGAKLLEEANDCDIIMMDELGPKEVDAHLFLSRVKERLDGDIPVMGVLMKKDSIVFDSVSGHPKVTVLEVTPENREKILQGLPPVEKWGEADAFENCK